MLPVHVRWCIRWAFLPTEALDFEACLEKNYRAKIAEEGPGEARRWLRLETTACIGRGFVRWGRPLFWWWWYS
jgi:hypothetical protein